MSLAYNYMESKKAGKMATATYILALIPLMLLNPDSFKLSELVN